MAGPKKRNSPRKRNDYVGTYDGSNSKVMTRRIVDTEGNTKKVMAPTSSKPQEATKFNEGYSRKTAKKQEIKTTRRGRR